jgi:trimeric autotransporter adhesin
MNRQVLIIILINLLHFNFLNAQSYTAIPDSCFEKALIEIGVDKIRDGKVLTSDIASLSYLYIISKNISDLSGIKDFKALKTLYCPYNNLKTIDLSGNLNLNTLDCSSNQLSSLSLTNNTQLVSLFCASNQLMTLDISKNKSLTTLNCSNNKLTSLDLSNNILLKELSFASNRLNSIGLINLVSLEMLNCSNNQLSILNTGLNTSLKTLICASNQLDKLSLQNNNSITLINCSNNQIDTLDVSSNLLLAYLTCSSNQLKQIGLDQNDSLLFLDIGNNLLSGIDLSHNDSLQSLICPSNQLKSFHIEKHPKIEKIDLSYNLIDSLDFGSNRTLKSIHCSSNLLSYLNVQNGRNGILESFNASENPYLRCIKVDDATFANQQVSWEKDSIATYNTNCAAYTYIPDNRFEAELIKLGYDHGVPDDYVLSSAIANITYLDLDSLNITDLTGIEDFIKLDSLDCSHNQLYNLDISDLTNLKKLDCSSDSLADLYLKNGANAKLIKMDARNNPKLRCILVDDTTGAKSYPGWFKDSKASYKLTCEAGKTKIPDQNFEKALIGLGYDKGSIDGFVVTDSIKSIKKLDISERNISTLIGISSFSSLDLLDCSGNNLDSIDLSANQKLNYLDCSGNSLTKLELQKDTLLIGLSCGDNKLTTIDLSKNTKLQSLQCNGNYLKNIVLDADTNLRELNVNSNLIANLKITSNKHLKKLYCANNKLGTINLLNNLALEDLDCAGNIIDLLNLDATKNLLRLNCSQNNLSSLDLSNDSLLVDVACNSNQLTALVLDRNSLLRKLNCSNNQLSNINLSTNDSMRQLIASSNSLKQLATNNLSFLDSLDVSGNQLSGLDISNNVSLQYLLCSDNNLQELDISKNIPLRTLKCENNQLKNLFLSKNTALVELHCSNNQIEGINLGSAIRLEELMLDNNSLISLDMGNNLRLKKVSCSNNKLTDLDFSALKDLKSMNCTSNFLTSIDARNGNNPFLDLFYSTNNPKLRCIEIDDESRIGASWLKDSTATFSENCHYRETYVPDDHFEAALSGIIGEPSNNNDNYIPTDSINARASLNISKQGIVDLTGIQDFKALTVLNCSANQIDKLNLIANVQLVNLNCANNRLDSLDLSQLDKLEILDFSNNLIDTINLAHLTALSSLYAPNNRLVNIDISFNTNLSSVDLSTNHLKSLKVNNGNNPILSSFNATNNLELFCIEVDEPVAAGNGTGVYASWLVDASVSFGTNCHYNETWIPDDAFEQALINMGYDNLLDDYVATAKINKITYLGLTGLGISDLTGIEDFSVLSSLNCSKNKLTALDLSSNPSLTTLICPENNLANLNIALNTALKKLDITGNQMADLDISTNLVLERLLCSSNLLRALNIISNSALIEVNASSNLLLSIDANNGFNQSLQNFDLRNNPELRCILVDDISAASSHAGWYKDLSASYKLECNDDDNDGVIDSEDQCPDTPFGDFVDLFGCSVFMLPEDNFTVLTKSETCRDANNGIVNISANEIFNYTATLIGTIDTIVFRFTNAADIRNLRADTYDLCITIDDIPTYSQCYKVVINQPEDLLVHSKIDQVAKFVTFKMSGGKHYAVEFNGLKFCTSDDEITFHLDKGLNSVQIMADAACQGIYYETFFLSDKAIAYPNPFDDNLFLFTGVANQDMVDVKIFSYTGQLILSNSYQGDNGIVQISTSSFSPGIYYASIRTGRSLSMIKIVKE